MEVKIPSQKVCVSLKPEKFNISLGTQIAREYVDREPYEGEYTITPSADAVVLETTGLRMTDNVTVSAIDPSYVGPDVPRDQTIELDANVVTVPAGYRTEQESVTVQAGSVSVPDTGITANPSISVSSGGLITATANATETIEPTVSAGYVTSGSSGTATVSGSNTLALSTISASTYTPTKTASIVIPDKHFLLGSQTIEAIPERFNDTSVDMSWLGLDVECVNNSLYSKSDKLSATDWHGWTPSTASKVCVASVTAGTFAADLAAYEYYIVWECSVDPVYNSGTTNKALSVLSRALIIQDICKRPSTPANAEAKIFNGNACVSMYTGTYLKYYGTTTNTLAQTWGASYGWYFGATAATFSNSTSDTPTVTVKTPTLIARCSTTYLSTTNAGLVDETKSSWYIKAKLYRVKVNGIYRNIYTKVCGLI